MPEKVYSEKVLMKDGILKVRDSIQGQNWGGRETVSLSVYSYCKEGMLSRQGFVVLSGKTIAGNGKATFEGITVICNSEYFYLCLLCLFLRARLNP